MNFTNRPRRGGKNTETIHDLQSQLAGAKAVVAMLKKDREDAESQLASAKMQIETLDYSLDEKNREIERLHDLIDHLKTGNEKLSLETFGLWKELSTAKAALEAEELKRMDWDVAFEGLEKQLAAAKASVKNILNLNSELEFQLGTAKAEIELNKRYEAKLNHRIDSLTVEIDNSYAAGKKFGLQMSLSEHALEMSRLESETKRLREALEKIANFKGDDELIADYCFLKALARAAMDGGNHDNKRD